MIILYESSLIIAYLEHNWFSSDRASPRRPQYTRRTE